MRFAPEVLPFRRMVTTNRDTRDPARDMPRARPAHRPRAATRARVVVRIARPMACALSPRRAPTYHAARGAAVHSSLALSLQLYDIRGDLSAGPRAPSPAQGTRGAQHAPPPLLPPLVKRPPEAAALNVGATASAGSELEVGECLHRPDEGGNQNLKSGGVSIAHANLARRVFGNCFWMGTSNRLHQAMVMRGSL